MRLMDMAKELRVSFDGAPAHVTKQVYGDLKWRKHIINALTSTFSGYAHERELFHWLNTDDSGKWLETVSDRGIQKGQKTVPVPMATLRAHLAIMVRLGDLKKAGDRNPTYGLPDFDFDNEDEADEDEAEDGTDE